MTTTDNIEEKKKAKSNNIKTDDWKKFITNFFLMFLVVRILIIGVVGSSGLYISKVAKSNILPTDVKFAPYTNEVFETKINPDVPVNKILMNVIKIHPWHGYNFWDPIKAAYTQKASFKDHTFDGSWLFNFLCGLDVNSKVKDGWFCSFRRFIHDNIKSDISSAFNLIHWLYSSTYNVPESWVIYIYPFVLPFILGGLSFINFFTNLFTHLKNTGYAFEDYTGQKDNWENGFYASSESSFLTRWLYPVYVILCWACFAIFSIYLAAFMAIIGPIYALLFALSSKYTLELKESQDPSANTSANPETHGFGTFLKDSFRYKKAFFMYLTASTLLTSIYSYLNSNYLWAGVIALILLTFAGYFAERAPDASELTMFNISVEELSKTINFVQQSDQGGVLKCETPSPTQASINPGQLGGGIRPKKLNKDGSCHKKYNFNLV